MQEKRSSFSSSLGFVMAAAGSAVGLGNIWRFPYLAAKDGGGVFILVYIILALTFGFTLLVTQVAIGRKTKQSQWTAYGQLSRKWRWVGILESFVPFVILPYYCVIGGWVLKYFVTFVTGGSAEAAEDGFFSGFITAQYSPIVFTVIFLGATVFIIYNGVESGIEKLSKLLMPVLIVMVIGISVYTLHISGTDPNGVTHTGWYGLKIYLIPDFSGMTIKEFIAIVMDAMGQLFYSISVAMGIMVAYGSYVEDDADLMKSVNQIEFFDTLVALLAGVMIIPAVVVFMGKEGMSSGGPGLMFITLPKVFASMGVSGRILGTIFFLMVILAALTSSMSILEAIVSGMMDRMHWSRKKASMVEGVLALALGVLVCLGYNVLYFEVKLPNGSVGQILDIMDYISNNILMPVVAIGVCILVGWVIKPDVIWDEVTKNGEKFKRKHLYYVMIRYIAPAMLIFLFLGSLGILKLR
ncbi:MAG: sodium-dependent transporter [Lachnospiraceae bacterium]|nr:sodium-dependent transporter [Lachnospiraceae bacterium]